MGNKLKMTTLDTGPDEAAYLRALLEGMECVAG
jgi:hypothetical protein